MPHCTEYPKYPFGNGSHFRTVSYAVLKNTETDEMLTVFNLHYDMTQDVNKKLENQLSESRQVIALAKTVLEKYGTNAIFVTGDYNSRIDGVPCEQMLANGFTDTYDLADEKDNIGSCAKLGAPLCGEYRTNAIDHVFYMGGKELRVNKYETVGSIRAASDHAPVLVTVEIN